MIDQARTSLLEQLSPELVELVERLPRSLGLGDRELLGDAVVLGLPSLVLCETHCDVAEPVCDAAQRAHLFALLATRIDLGIGSGEFPAVDEFDAMLASFERERNRALAELRMAGADRNLNFSLPEREVRAALADERAVFEGHTVAGMADYLTISTAKQGLALLAVSAAAAASNLDIDTLGHIHELSLGVLLGLQVCHDIEHWLDEPEHTDGWIAALSRQAPVLEVVEHTCEFGRTCFLRAADAARVLGANSLMVWAQAQAHAIRMLRRRADRHTVDAMAS